MQRHAEIEKLRAQLSKGERKVHQIRRHVKQSDGYRKAMLGKHRLLVR